MDAVRTRGLPLVCFILPGIVAAVVSSAVVFATCRRSEDVSDNKTDAVLSSRIAELEKRLLDYEKASNEKYEEQKVAQLARRRKELLRRFRGAIEISPGAAIKEELKELETELVEIQGPVAAKQTLERLEVERQAELKKSVDAELERMRGPEYQRAIKSLEADVRDYELRKSERP